MIPKDWYRREAGERGRLFRRLFFPPRCCTQSKGCWYIARFAPGYPETVIIYAGRAANGTALKIPDLRRFLYTATCQPAPRIIRQLCLLRHQCTGRNFHDTISYSMLASRNMSRVYLAMFVSLESHGTYIETALYVNTDDFINLSVYSI